MILKNLKKLLNIKFTILTIVLFIIISNLSKNFLVNFLNYSYPNYKISSSDISYLDILLSNFLFFDYDYSIIDLMQLVCIYLIPFVYLTNFAYKNLINMNLYILIRLKNFYSYIYSLFIPILISSIYYFSVGYITTILLNINNSNTTIMNLLLGDTFSYIDIIFKIFLLNNLIIVSLVSISVSISILLSNIHIAPTLILSIFSMGIIGEINFIPGYHAVLSNIFSYETLSFVNSSYITYTVLFLASILILIYIIKSKRELILTIGNL